MKILSFDTSGQAMHIALLEDRAPVFELERPPAVQNRQESASMLLPCIDEALNQVGWSKQDLSLVVVGAGPGSFTGVRVAVVTARAMGQALNLAVAAVSSLEVIAFAGTRPCAVVMPAGAGKAFAASYQDLGLELVCPKEAPFCAAVEDVESRLQECRQWLVDEEMRLVLRLNERQDSLSFPQIKNIATLGAILTHDRLSLKGVLPEAGKTKQALIAAFPWQSVVPLYLRSPSVTIKADHGITNKANDAC